MLTMAPADSVIRSLRPGHGSPPAHAAWLSWGPVLTPDRIDSVFDGCHAFLHEDRPAAGVHGAFRFGTNVVPGLDSAKK